MNEIAEQTGLSRESFYKALRTEGNPELATKLKVVRALGGEAEGAGSVGQANCQLLNFNAGPG